MTSCRQVLLNTHPSRDVKMYCCHGLYQAIIPSCEPCLILNIR